MLHELNFAVSHQRTKIIMIMMMSEVVVIMIKSSVVRITMVNLICFFVCVCFLCVVAHFNSDLPR